MLTMHPMITGHWSRIMYLKRLISYMKSIGPAEPMQLGVRLTSHGWDTRVILS
jgi:hypothetical protein